MMDGAVEERPMDLTRAIGRAGQGRAGPGIARDKFLGEGERGGGDTGGGYTQVRDQVPHTVCRGAPPLPSDGTASRALLLPLRRKARSTGYDRHTGAQGGRRLPRPGRWSRW
jgi:hypothetical protein